MDRYPTSQMDPSRRPATHYLPSPTTRSASVSPVQSAHQSPSSYHHVSLPQGQELNEKSNLPPASHASRAASPVSPGGQPRSAHTHAHSTFLSPSYHQYTPSPISTHIIRSSLARSQYTRPRGLRIANLLRPWIPIIIYAAASLLFVIAFAFYKDELFMWLEELSQYLQADKQFGYAILFLLIFITTIPPFPLYSTFITLSGYTFGPWTGAIISYFAALSGALIVFIISRTLLRNIISRWLASAGTMRRVILAVEKRPKLLFLIRLAPYPYNVMNCLLAAAPTLTLQTYTICTALSLFKVIIHTSLGASIHSFKDYHSNKKTDGNEDGNTDFVARAWTIGGIVLCVAILAYLSIVARRAVNDELEDGSRHTEDGSDEETVAFLAEDDLEAGLDMTESPFKTNQVLPTRLASPSPDSRH